MSQTTNHILLVKPHRFYLNSETAVNNYFQQEGNLSDNADELSQIEFNGFVSTLEAHGVNVLVDQSPLENSPDAIFPNNWISTHEDGSIVLYPMYAKNRRMERRNEVLERLKKDFDVASVNSLVHWEERGLFLEGTGSLILDRKNRLAYASLSERTNSDVLKDFSAKTQYEVVSFGAFQNVNQERLPIYHTNVLMAVGSKFAVVCLSSIDNGQERKRVVESLEKTKKTIVDISEDQMAHFCGNILEVKSQNNDNLIVMSTQAYDHFSQEQRDILSEFGKIVHSSISTIETLGGGGVRCMMAEIFLPRKN